MPKRSITDSEIALIKALLDRGRKNRDIQFYFNRPDRPVNSGRITQIRMGTYGPDIKSADNATVAAFLIAREEAAKGIPAKRSIGERVKDHFCERDSGWFLQTHETDEFECKQAFPGIKPADRLGAIVKAIAGLANNKGGFIFLGVQELEDKSLKVIGLEGKMFSTLDPGSLDQILISTLDPVPVFALGLADIGGMQIGFIEVARHDNAPVIATKNLGTDVKEGGVYYRYVGETRLIRPGELRELISSRERRAVERFASEMARVAQGSATTVDLETGRIAGTNAQFLLDEASLKKIQFLREGDFKQKEGAPALKLVGDVRVATATPITKIVRQNITQDDILRNFLIGELVADPLQYIMASSHVGRIWLPIWYYVQLSKLEIDDIVAALMRERPGQPKHREFAIARLRHKISAYYEHTGTPKKMLPSILDGTFAEPKQPKEDSTFALAIQSLPKAAKDMEKVRAALAKAATRAQGSDPQTSNIRSSIFRAACRLDEILYQKPAASK